jgi:hypothetical protein
LFVNAPLFGFFYFPIGTIAWTRHLGVLPTFLAVGSANSPDDLTGTDLTLSK